MHFLAVSMALCAAALFGLNVHIQRKAGGQGNALEGAFLSVASMSLMFWLAAPFVVHSDWWLTRGALIFALSGLFFPAMGQTLQITSVKRVGPALTSSIGAFTPMFSVIPAVLFLGETFTTGIVAGIALMMAGMALAAQNRRGSPRQWPVWFLLIPLGAAFFRGVAQPITKLGFADMPSPYFAALLASTVSSVVLLMLVALTRKKAAPTAAGRGRARLIFALSGVINGFGILSLNTAIQSGSLLIAAPLASTAPLWALAFGAFIFRNEDLRRKHLIIAILVIVGAILIILH